MSRMFCEAAAPSSYFLTDFSSQTQLTTHCDVCPVVPGFRLENTVFYKVDCCPLRVPWGHDDRGSELTLLLSPGVLGISSPLPQTQNHGPQMSYLNSCRPVSDFLDEKAMHGLKQIHQQVSVQPSGPPLRCLGASLPPRPSRSSAPGAAWSQSWGVGHEPWG